MVNFREEMEDVDFFYNLNFMLQINGNSLSLRRKPSSFGEERDSFIGFSMNSDPISTADGSSNMYYNSVTFCIIKIYLRFQLPTLRNINDTYFSWILQTRLKQGLTHSV